MSFVTNKALGFIEDNGKNFDEKNKKTIKFLADVKVVYIFTYIYVSVVNLISTTARTEALDDEDCNRTYNLSPLPEHTNVQVRLIGNAVLWSCRDESVTKYYYQFLYKMLIVVLTVALVGFFIAKLIALITVLCNTKYALNKLWHLAIISELIQKVKTDNGPNKDSAGVNLDQGAGDVNTDKQANDTNDQHDNGDDQPNVTAVDVNAADITSDVVTDQLTSSISDQHNNGNGQETVTVVDVNTADITSDVIGDQPIDMVSSTDDQQRQSDEQQTATNITTIETVKDMSSDATTSQQLHTRDHITDTTEPDTKQCEGGRHPNISSTNDKLDISCNPKNEEFCKHLFFKYLPDEIYEQIKECKIKSRLAMIIPIILLFLLVAAMAISLLSYDLHPLGCIMGPEKDDIKYKAKKQKVEIDFPDSLENFQIAAGCSVFILGVLYLLLAWVFWRSSEHISYHLLKNKAQKHITVELAEFNSKERAKQQLA